MKTNEHTRIGPARWLLPLQPESWRSDLLRIVLRVTAVLGVVVYVPSVWLAWVNSMMGVVVLDTLCLAGLLALAAAERMPHLPRALGTVAVTYLLGAGLMITVGSISQIYLFAFSLFATLLLGIRWGLGAVALSAATMLLIGGVGIAAPEMVMSQWKMDLPGWSLITANFVFVDLSLVLSFGAVIAALERSNTSLKEEVVRRARTEDSLRESKALLRTAGRTARLGGWRLSAGKALVWSDELRELHELPEGAQPTLDEALQFYPPEYQELAKTVLRECLEEGRPFDVEAELVTARGKPLWVRILGSADRSADGTITHAHGSVQDITTQKLAEVHHQKLEGQLLQLQKMEAVGSLAGGVAHDFNNLLSVILSYCGFILDELAPDHPLRADVEEIKASALRAAELTRQLLAFSRKQMLRPEVFDVNEVVAGVQKMLARLLSEDIKFTLLRSKEPACVFADVGQWEQVIVNLVLNARDAMPSGGKLTLEIANTTLDAAYAAEHAGVVPGEYVMLAVADTGVGMDRATRARIFEPFFTTKDKSKGTGLGLSTVYGIVQQSGGHLWVYSEPGVGTTFKVYLPRTALPLPTGEKPASPAPVSLSGSETVLVVEDEPQVREVMALALRKHGYNVLEAQNAGEAFLTCEQFPATIHLLLTDVVMPQLSGRQLAERLKPIRPLMRVLYVSGYTENTIVHHGVLESGIEFLAKPILPEALLRKVREVLDA